MSANAQEVKSNEEYLAETPANKVAFEPTSSHWFIQALGGINVPFYTHWIILLSQRLRKTLPSATSSAGAPASL